MTRDRFIEVIGIRDITTTELLITVGRSKIPRYAIPWNINVIEDMNLEYKILPCLRGAS